MVHHKLYYYKKLSQVTQGAGQEELPRRPGSRARGERHSLGSGPPREQHIDALVLIWLRTIYGSTS